MNKKEPTLDSAYIYRGKVVTLRKDTVLLPNGRKGEREIVEHPGAVAVVPVTAEGKIIFVKQYRKPLEQETIEIPAGKLDRGEGPEKCALRELQEEIGFLGKLEYKFSYFTTPGFSDEIMHLFIARDLEQSYLACDEDEFIEKLEVSPSEALHMIMKGEIKDAKTIIGIFTFLQEGHRQ
ncbi:NUDIX hydrolase [Candidatus Formimonas warabiya]|uniref:ADP-ribose pyrophosphatase n=1 Tax=Formimonas warabiya TaxID=1761012 RepID=A0A3G1KNN4_FORW1|nr:NUDIX hydrolase [Candidatus Formimonas warabiya]ATW24072.1 ADP-ribose pyrophosphatase [Candidatus Formimonas warabiya]